LGCNIEDTAQQIEFGNIKIKRLFKSDNEENYFYGISSRPPAIVEFDMNDIDNIIVSTTYNVDYDDSKYYGELYAQANKNFILHLLTNPDTNRQVIRVFSRTASLLNAARVDIPIYQDTIVNWFQFPNHFFNILVFRDERTINITGIIDLVMILNGTNADLVQKYNEQKFKVTIYPMDSLFLEDQRFTVKFVNQTNFEL
jgi:hypothetical protein